MANTINPNKYKPITIVEEPEIKYKDENVQLIMPKYDISENDHLYIPYK